MAKVMNQAKETRSQKLLRSELVACAAEAVRIKFFDETQNEEVERRCNDLAIRLRDIAELEAQMFSEAWNKKAEEVNATAKAKGWWDAERNDGEIIALMHSELSEALEALRHGNKPDDHIPEFLGTEAEMADVVIRIMDYGKARGLRIGEAIEAKMEYNANRERMHGGKAF